MDENREAGRNDPSTPFIVRDLNTLKVLTDPLHLQILEILVHEALTVRQIADKLGLAPSKLYYHINLMEKHGLIKIVETRMVANMVEKLYRATSNDVDIDPNLISFVTEAGKESIHSIAVSTLDTTRADLQRSLEARAFNLEHGDKEQPRSAIVTRTTANLTEERAKEFHTRLQQLLREFERSDEKDANLQSYALTIVYYPSFYYHQEPKSDE